MFLCNFFLLNTILFVGNVHSFKLFELPTGFDVETDKFALNSCDPKSLDCSSVNRFSNILPSIEINDELSEVSSFDREKKKILKYLS